jgi:hypothetical protein
MVKTGILNKKENKMQELERNKIRTKLVSFDCSELQDIFDEVEAGAAMERFQAVINQQLGTVAARAADKCVLDVETTSDGYGNDALDCLTLYAERFETDEEMQKRIRYEKTAADWAAIRDRQLYECLKKKFEGQ